MKNLCVHHIIIVIVIVMFISFLNQSIHFYKYLQESNVYVDPRSVILNSKFSFRIKIFKLQKNYHVVISRVHLISSFIVSLRKNLI